MAAWQDRDEAYNQRLEDLGQSMPPTGGLVFYQDEDEDETETELAARIARTGGAFGTWAA